MRYVARLRGARQWNSTSSTSAYKGDSRMSTSALTDAIYQNTPGNSEGYPLGVPTSMGWYYGDTGYENGTAPSNYTSMTGWGVIYPEAGQPVDSSATVQIANYNVYL